MSLVSGQCPDTDHKLNMPWKRTRSSSSVARKRFRSAVVPRKLSSSLLDRQRVVRAIRSAHSTVHVDDAACPGVLTWCLNDLPSSAEFTALFDEYRIDYIDVKFMYDKSVAESVPEGGSFLPIIYLVKDYDDSTPPGTDYATLLQYDNLVVRRLDKDFTVRIRPRASVAAYSGTFTSYMAAPSKAWCDCNSPSVAFYGIKYIVDGGIEGGVGTKTIGHLRMISTYHMSFRGMK